MRTPFTSSLQSVSDLLHQSSTTSAVLQYTVATLAKAPGVSALPKLAEKADTLLNSSFETALKLQGDVASRVGQVQAQVAHHVSDHQQMKQLALESYQSVVDSAWFQQVNSILTKEKATELLASTYAQLDRQTFEQYAMNLRTRLATEYNEKLLVPAKTFYTLAHEKYGQKNGHLDVQEIVQDVRQRLGDLYPVFQEQLVQAYSTRVDAPAKQLYNQCVELYAKLRAQQAELKPQEWVSSVRQSLGHLWDERLREPVQTWLQGAQNAASQDLQKLSHMMDRDQDGKVTRSDAVLMGKEVLSYLYSSSLSVAQHTVDYLLPESKSESVSTSPLSPGSPAANVVAAPDSPGAPASTSTSASELGDAQTQRVLSDSFFGLFTATKSRVTQRLQHGLQQLRQAGSQVDVLAYSESLFAAAQAQLQLNAASMSLANVRVKVQDALLKGQTAVQYLRQQQALRSQEIKSRWMSALERVEQVATLVRSVDYKTVPQASLSLIAQSLGFQPKDSNYELVMQHIQTLFTSVKRVVKLQTDGDCSTPASPSMCGAEAPKSEEDLSQAALLSDASVIVLPTVDAVVTPVAELTQVESVTEAEVLPSDFHSDSLESVPCVSSPVAESVSLSSADDVSTAASAFESPSVINEDTSSSVVSGAVSSGSKPSKSKRSKA